MKKICAIMIVLFAVSGVYAQVNTVGTVINNQASITAGNVSSAVLGNTTSTTVARMGGAAYATISGDVSASPLGTALAPMTFRNYGNGNDMFLISIVARQSNTVDWAGDTAWTVDIRDAGNTTTINQSTLLAPAGGTFTFNIRVQVPVTADDGDYLEFQVAVTSLSNPTARTYTDDTGYVWGRTIGYSWAGVEGGTLGLLQHAFTNNNKLGTATPNQWIRFSIQGPVLSITKTVTSILVNGVADVPKPGAVITWTIRITNDGTASATNIIVRDTRPANTTFVGRTTGAYLTATGGADPNYTWSGVNLPSKTADTVTFSVRIQ